MTKTCSTLDLERLGIVPPALGAEATTPGGLPWSTFEPLSAAAVSSGR